MNILACETSTLVGSIAILQGDKSLAFRKWERQGSHSETLNTQIQDCLSELNLKLNDIHLFCSGLGPGSFTGIRVSLNAVKTFSAVFKKPCLGLNSLQNIAEQNKLLNTSITVMLNAYKNMVYFAEYSFYENRIIEIQSPRVVRVQDLINRLNPNSLVVGDGYLDYKKYIDDLFQNRIIRVNTASDFPDARQICDHVILTRLLSNFENNPFSNLNPLYLRDSEAEENLKGIVYQALK